MNLRIATVAVLLACALPGRASAESALSAIYSRNRSALVFLEVEYKDVNGQMQTDAGTGFIVSRQGHVVTAGHLVPAAGNPGLKLMGRVATRFAFPALLEVVDRGSGGGLALLKLPDIGADYAPVAVGHSRAVKRGSEIYAMGFALTSEPSVTGGVVGDTSARSDGAVGRRWRTSLALDPGQSGGPVFDSRGVVVAVVAPRQAPADATGLVIPIDAAGPLLRLIPSDDARGLAR
jgi:S1-C subfamily serine protease